jgi:hypothetical protein
VQPVPVHPGDRIDIDAEGVVHDREPFDEPFLVVERAVRDAHVDDGGQVQPGEEPADDQVGGADQQAQPGTEVRRREVRAGQGVGEEDCIPGDVIDLHNEPP